VGVEDDARGKEAGDTNRRRRDEAQDAIKQVLVAVFAGQHGQDALAQQGQQGDFDERRRIVTRRSASSNSKCNSD
jgi:hypothetical protein